MSKWIAVLAAIAAVPLAAGAVAAPAAAAPGPSAAPEYWFESWDVPQLWASGARGQGVTIAEIDTGVNASLPELSANVLSGIDLGEHGNGQIDRQINDFGHGTAMASIMVAQPGLLDITGLAPDSKILPIAVPLTGTSDSADNDHLATAIRYAADHGGKIISMSLGGTRTPAKDSEPCPSDEQNAIYYALSKGDILIAAVGNNGPAADTVEEPAVCLGVISVGAVDQTDTVAAFSSREPYLTLSAPGVDIASLSRIAGEAYTGDGTSQAAAITSAVVALVWSRYPRFTGRQIVTRLLATLDRHTATEDPAYGYGIVNAYRAVTAAVRADAPNPVYSAVAPFLARYEAFGHPPAPPAPSPPRGARSSLGSFESGDEAAPTGSGVVLGLEIAGLGVLLLVALTLLAVRRRRRRQSEKEQPRPGSTWTDAEGLRWHEITGPPKAEPQLPAASRPPARPQGQAKPQPYAGRHQRGSTRD